MGAIYGIWNRNGQKVDRKELIAMKEALAGYGDSSQDPAFHQCMAFGCLDRRTNTQIEPNRIEYAPHNPDLALLADARIYNRKELLEDLHMQDLHNISDSALLMAAYLRWGDQTPLHLNGDFVFSILDLKNRHIRIFSDHLGVRPLFYYETADRIVFATDMKAILALSGIPRKVNEVMLYRRLTSNYVAIPEDTHIEGIMILPQAHILHINEHQLRKEKYWTPGQNPRKDPQEEECAQHIQDLMRNAVEIRVDAVSGPMAIELSGGLDSSAITVFAARHLRTKGKKCTCYSWSPSFELVPEQERDERKLAEAVCAQEDLECAYFFIEEKEECAQVLFVEPDGVLVEEHRYLSGKGIKAVFSGWGGDQAITHRANLSELKKNGYKGPFFAEIKRVTRLSFLRGIRLYLSHTEPFESIFRVCAPKRRIQDRLIHKKFKKRMRAQLGQDQLQFNRDLLRHLESGNIQTRTHMAARLSARFGIEYFFPFLDHRLVDLAFSLPRHFFYKNGINRYIARKALIDVLPEEVRQYVPKDDIVRCSYFGAQFKVYDAAAPISLEGIQQNLFDSYVDFAAFAKWLHSKEIQTDQRLRSKARNCILFLQHVQADILGLEECP